MWSIRWLALSARLSGQPSRDKKAPRAVTSNTSGTCINYIACRRELEDGLPHGPSLVTWGFRARNPMKASIHRCGCDTANGQRGSTRNVVSRESHFKTARVGVVNKSRCPVLIIIDLSAL